MAGFTTLDTTGFDSAIAAFRNALECYQDARNTLKQHTDTLKNSWTGKGGEKYETVSGKILKLLEDDGDSLEYIIKNLEEILKLYKEADEKVAKDIGNSDVGSVNV